MNEFEALLYAQQDVKVIDASRFVKIDLSDAAAELSNIDLSNAKSFEDYIENYLLDKQATVAFGGYNEKRSLYRRSGLFKIMDTEERNIHIGLDLWIKAGTPILAALDGKVHSFRYNTGLGNYGPTIILEHNIQGHRFYTLYGHLSLASIETIAIGDIFKKGETIATLGVAAVNGDYAPHLHFQIIKNIADNFGDYPGVCTENNLSFYLENSPNPNLLLKINE